jgi:hypothetical protein
VISINPGFEDEGSYPVTITVSDGTLSASESFTIVVGGTNRAPSLAAISDLNVAEDASATVTLSGSDADGDAVTYSATGLPAFASLTDNVISINPGFEDEGSYPVTITVSDGTLSASESFTIVVGNTNNSPLALIEVISSAAVNSSITLDGSNSSDPDSDLLSFEWKFDSIPAQSSLTVDSIVNNLNAVASFTPDVVGDFVVSLTVTDGETSHNAKVTINVYALNVPPVSNAGEDTEVVLGQLATLDGSGSTDVDNGPLPLTYKWSFVSVPDSSSLESYDISSNDGLVASFYPDSAGEYVLELTVNDGEFENTDFVVINVIESNVPPTVDAGSDQQVDFGESVYLQGAGSDPDFGPELISFEWDFVSIPVGSLLGQNDFTAIQSEVSSFTPDIEGEYVLSLTASDGEGIAIDHVVINVINIAGIAPETPIGVEGRTRRGNVTLVWDAVETADSYKVYRKGSNESEFSLLATTNNAYISDVFSSGESSIEYYVVSENTYGESDASLTVSITNSARR